MLFRLFANLICCFLFRSVGEWNNLFCKIANIRNDINKWQWFRNFSTVLRSAPAWNAHSSELLRHGNMNNAPKFDMYDLTDSPSCLLVWSVVLVSLGFNFPFRSVVFTLLLPPVLPATGLSVLKLPTLSTEEVLIGLFAFNQYFLEHS